jgi:hypothetical protein
LCCDISGFYWLYKILTCNVIENFRVMSLKASNDDFPVNIILVDKDDDVVAHCRLTKVSDDSEGLLIETGMLNFGKFASVDLVEADNCCF